MGLRRCPSGLALGLHQGPKVVPHVLDARKEQQMTPLTLTMVPGQLCGEVRSGDNKGWR